MGVFIILIGLIYAISPNGMKQMKCAKDITFCDQKSDDNKR